MQDNFNIGPQFNVNFNNQDFLAPIRPQSQTFRSEFNQLLSDLFGGLSKLFDQMSQGQFNSGGQQPSCGCSSPPQLPDSSHPSGSLKADDGKVTTPGGYTIEPMSKFEWKITGPDGKSTRIWGDPHVAESDGGKWDFKRNSTFMLPDGTKINVTTAPWKNGMTVTGGLEIINGNDRVQITDIDKGKGKIGQVTPDGFAHANSFGNNDVFVMGKESDDWSHQGKEIIGSNNGGSSFKYGNELAPGVMNNAGGLNQMGDIISQFLDELLGNWGNNNTQGNQGTNPYWGTDDSDIFGNQKPMGDDLNSQRGHGQRQQMMEMFKALSQMFDILSRLAGMGDAMFANRQNAMPV